MLKVRGTLLRSTVNYAAGHLSPEMMRRWLDGLTPEDRSLIAAPPSGQAWYPVEILTRLMESYLDLSGGNAETECGAMGRAACDDALSALLPQGAGTETPEYVVRRAVSLWGHFYDRGECEVHLERPGEVVFRVHGIGPASRTLCHRISGWMQRALELAGAREPKVSHASCSFGGRKFEEWRAVWKS